MSVYSGIRWALRGERTSSSPQLYRMRKGSDRVDISPEHGRRFLVPALPRPGSDTSWRDTPQSPVILQVLSGVLLVCLGVLLGATWTTQALQPRLRRQAEERRRLNAEWLAVRTARRKLGRCPRCGSLLTELEWYLAPAIVEDSADDD